MNSKTNALLQQLIEANIRLNICIAFQSLILSWAAAVALDIWPN